MCIHFIQSLITSILAFMIYLEASPKIGHIWIRPNSFGTMSLSLNSLWNLIYYACTHWSFWNPMNWDLNYFIWLLCFYVIL